MVVLAEAEFDTLSGAAPLLSTGPNGVLREVEDKAPLAPADVGA